MFNIFESVYCTVPEDRIVGRSWKERLFSWPWKPWSAKKTIVIQAPDEHVYVVGHDVVCRPAIARQIRAQFPIF